MQDSSQYLKIHELEDNHCYKICATHAYVGIWISSEKMFLISRYKVGPNPYIDYEYHWDAPKNARAEISGIHEPPYGTVKPIELIEKSPFVIKEDYDKKEKDELLKYLDNLEECNPIIDGYNSLQERRMGAINFERRLAGKPVIPLKNNRS